MNLLTHLTKLHTIFYKLVKNHFQDFNRFMLICDGRGGFRHWQPHKQSLHQGQAQVHPHTSFLKCMCTHTHTRTHPAFLSACARTHTPPSFLLPLTEASKTCWDFLDWPVCNKGQMKTFNNVCKRRWTRKPLQLFDSKWQTESNTWSFFHEMHDLPSFHFVK